ncbi:MAG: hypothetical protein JWM43_2250 [Acidobacteriaceae bacterium]|nr:hypothetical protein [Acidobacteriaceae bacterium]
MNPLDVKSQQHDPLENHLGEDQITDCLIGSQLTAEVVAHLAYCEACNEKLAAFGMSVASFNTASLAWSEACPVPSLHEASRIHAQRPFLAATWALAAGTLLVIGGSTVSTVLHRQNAERATTVASISASESESDSDAEIAQDNKLLLEVDQAISTSDRSPIQEYGLETTTGLRHRTPGKARIQ